ncbi:MAG: hypothetical protein AAGG44_12675 [Planctomycetota bacterium]
MAFDIDFLFSAFVVLFDSVIKIRGIGMRRIDFEPIRRRRITSESNSFRLGRGRSHRYHSLSVSCVLRQYDNRATDAAEVEAEM